MFDKEGLHALVFQNQSFKADIKRYSTWIIISNLTAGNFSGINYQRIIRKRRGGSKLILNGSNLRSEINHFVIWSRRIIQPGR